jgi:hypothetical protein
MPDTLKLNKNTAMQIYQSNGTLYNDIQDNIKQLLSLEQEIVTESTPCVSKDETDKYL